VGLEAVVQFIKRDPQKAKALLASLMVLAAEATQDIRRLVYDLRPPALDDLGLAGALRQRAAHYEMGGLRFHFAIQEPLPELPAAVETAVFRIAQEAMTNVVRHAQATQCSVRLFCREGCFVVEVQDNGQGIADSHRPGVGLQAMEERAFDLKLISTIRNIIVPLCHLPYHR